MSTVFQAPAQTQEKLVNDLKTVIADAENILAATAEQASDKVTNLRAKVQTGMHDVRERLDQVQSTLSEKSKAAAVATDNYVHQSPWTAIGMAASVGLVLGLFAGRR
ncbi:MAG: hypothetical protein RJA34_1898 [Pseudomonadota bacterium]